MVKIQRREPALPLSTSRLQDKWPKLRKSPVSFCVVVIQNQPRIERLHGFISQSRSRGKRIYAVAKHADRPLRLGSIRFHDEGLARRQNEPYFHERRIIDISSEIRDNPHSGSWGKAFQYGREADLFFLSPQWIRWCAIAHWAPKTCAKVARAATLQHTRTTAVLAVHPYLLAIVFYLTGLTPDGAGYLSHSRGFSETQLS